MSTSVLTALVEGSFTIEPSKDTEKQSGRDDYTLCLLPGNKSPRAVNGSQLETVDSSGSFVTLPVSANNGGRVFYLRQKGSAAGAIVVELTHLGAGAKESDIQGMMLVEVPEAERITQVRVKGVTEFEWSLSGPLV